MLLAIDTSAGTSAAVLGRDAEVLAELSVDDNRRHAEAIGDLIARSLVEASVVAAEIQHVAVGMGPGPFTGLRVGIAAARAFAFGIGKPLLPVVSHDAIAFGHPAPSIVVTDARRREVYWSQYDAPDEHGLPVRSRGPELAKPDALPAGRHLRAERVSAGALGRLALLSQLHGRALAAAEPLYLRSPDVTMSPTNASGRRVT